MRYSRRFQWAAALAALYALAACADDPVSSGPVNRDLDAQHPSALISDGGRNGGTPGFNFLVPITIPSGLSGQFDASLSPVVTIHDCGTNTNCTAASVHATFAGPTGPTVSTSTQSYTVMWKTRETGAVAGRFYRIVVSVNGKVLGFADVQVVRRIVDLLRVDLRAFVGVVEKTILPIRFRIAKGIPATMSLTPANPTIAAGATQQFTATVLDLGGNAVPNAVVSWSSGNIAAATINGSGLATGVAGGASTITATSGALSASTTLTVQAAAAAPVAEDDQFTLTAGQSFNLSAAVLTNDNVGNPAAGIVLDEFTPGLDISPILCGLSLCLMVHENTAGQYSVKYSLTNASGSEQATVTITVNPAVPSNLAVYPMTASVPAGTSIQFDAVLFDQYDNVIPGHTVSWSPPTGGTAATLSALTGPTVIANTSATITASEALQFVVTSGAFSRTVNLSVIAPSGSAPAALNDEYHATLPAGGTGVTVTGNLIVGDLGNGADLVGSPAATLQTFGSGSLGGTSATNAAGATVAGANSSTLTVNANGSFSFTGQVAGTYTFEYVIGNGIGTSTATVTIVVHPPQTSGTGSSSGRPKTQ